MSRLGFLEVLHSERVDLTRISGALRVWESSTDGVLHRPERCVPSSLILEPTVFTCDIALYVPRACTVCVDHWASQDPPVWRALSGLIPGLSAAEHALEYTMFSCAQLFFVERNLIRTRGLLGGPPALEAWTEDLCVRSEVRYAHLQASQAGLAFQEGVHLALRTHFRILEALAVRSGGTHERLSWEYGASPEETAVLWTQQNKMFARSRQYAKWHKEAVRVHTQAYDGAQRIAAAPLVLAHYRESPPKQGLHVAAMLRPLCVAQKGLSDWLVALPEDIFDSWLRGYCTSESIPLPADPQILENLVGLWEPSASVLGSLPDACAAAELLRR